MIDSIYVLVVLAMIVGSGNGSGADIEVSTHQFNSPVACAAVADLLNEKREFTRGSARSYVEAFCVKDK